ncbi:hypothetical protein AJ80_07495 [Polytolypa hystricis UAMH7299]|uniref:Beta-xylanase n=1 Tax=Polytolypa hystricis (strain UAMH7299) TaxID=1447883 RepID=A0A2B7XNJ8_POLH7|nr:hypothetical protein AJ80_07495 [Polytolypa hystricis UAMH7299]
MYSTSLLSLLAVPLTALAFPTTSLSTRQELESLHDKYVAAGKQYFGTIADEALLADEQNVGIIQQVFGQLTAENSMKWESIQPTLGGFNFAQPDVLVDFATANNMLIRGHTLIWHSQLPQYVSDITDAAELTEVIETHISEIMGRYVGKIFQWDVVNEIFNEDGSFRDSVFFNVLGEDFVRIAFEAAKAADPDAKLYINDFNLDSADNAKVQAMVTNVNKWVAEGVPIDGIGSQAHIAAGQGSAIPDAIKALAAADVAEVAITELDIADAPAEDYQQSVDACTQEPKCVGVTVWGVRDNDSWRPGTNPLLFDATGQPKEAYNTLVSNL